MSTISLAPLTITPIVVPATLDAADAGPFRAIVELGNAVCRADAGHDHFDTEPAEVLPMWKDQSEHRRLGFAAERDGRIVGVVTIDIPLEQGATALEFDLLVDPPQWGQGVEDALLDVVERTAREAGRLTLQTYTLHRADASGERLVAPTGFGSIPADDRQTRFPLEHGFTLEQVERNSVLELSSAMPRVQAMLDEALAHAGADYELVSWTLPTPPELREQFAAVIARMSTDVPTGDMEWAEEVWDAARVERRDKRLADGGLTLSVACVRHVPSDTLVAYNELEIAADPSATTHQWGTLVVAEHRGHRLGTIVKCANLLRWRTLFPRSPRVSTFNAEENRPMLDINEAIGFVPASYAGGWKKVLV